jgi:hypothetical protein
MMMTEQARKIKHKAIPEWAEGALLQQGDLLRSNRLPRRRGHLLRVQGKDDGIVRFTFDHLEGLKIVEDEEEPANTTQ